MTSTPISSSALTVERFDVTERVLHWAIAIPFLIALLTGLALYFPDLAKLAGSREVVRNIHRISGFAIIPLAALIVLVGNRRRLREDLQTVDVWSRNDRRWMRAWLWRKVGGRDELPPQGRFNAGQKFNSVVTAAGVLWLTLTGILIFPSIHPPFWVVTNARGLHNLTWILMSPVLAGHIFLSAIYPPTRPGLNGMFGGRVRLAWLREHHPLAPEAQQPPT